MFITMAPADHINKSNQTSIFSSQESKSGSKTIDEHEMTATEFKKAREVAAFLGFTQTHWPTQVPVDNVEGRFSRNVKHDALSKPVSCLLRDVQSKPDWSRLLFGEEPPTSSAVTADAEMTIATGTTSSVSQ